MQSLLQCMVIIAVAIPGLRALLQCLRTRSSTAVPAMRRSGLLALGLAFLLYTVNAVIAFNAVAKADAASKATMLAQGLSLSGELFWLGVVLGGGLVVVGAFLRGLWPPTDRSRSPRER